MTRSAEQRVDRTFCRSASGPPTHGWSLCRFMLHATASSCAERRIHTDIAHSGGRGGCLSSRQLMTKTPSECQAPPREAVILATLCVYCKGSFFSKAQALAATFRFASQPLSSCLYRRLEGLAERMPQIFAARLRGLAGIGLFAQQTSQRSLLFLAAQTSRARQACLPEVACWCRSHARCCLGAASSCATHTHSHSISAPFRLFCRLLTSRVRLSRFRRRVCRGEAI